MSGVKVAVRIRPLSNKEINNGARKCCHVIKGSNVVVIKKEARDPYLKSQGMGVNEYEFDEAFDDDCTQQEVYEKTTKPYLNNLVNGLNVTVFAYGATGAGKTHTMMGNSRVDSASNNAEAGIIPNSLQDLFKLISDKQQLAPEEKWTIICSFMEVYNEQVYDLVEPTGKVLSIREDQERGIVVVAGLAEKQVKCPEDVFTMLNIGNRNRKTESTMANQVSSRSHAILQLSVKRTRTLESGREATTESKLNLIDLAGSERASATNNRGARLNEGANINKSLLALANCINALAGNNSSNRRMNVKYRDSKLTHLLKSSLEGNCNLIMIANVNPSNVTYEDSHNTLKYSNRAKNIKVNPHAIEHKQESSWVEREHRLRAENAKLRKRVEELEEENARLRATPAAALNAVVNEATAASVLNKENKIPNNDNNCINSDGNSTDSHIKSNNNDHDIADINTLTGDSVSVEAEESIEISILGPDIIAIDNDANNNNSIAAEAGRVHAQAVGNDDTSGGGKISKRGNGRRASVAGTNLVSKDWVTGINANNANINNNNESNMINNLVDDQTHGKRPWARRARRASITSLSNGNRDKNPIRSSSTSQLPGIVSTSTTTHSSDDMVVPASALLLGLPDIQEGETSATNNEDQDHNGTEVSTNDIISSKTIIATMANGGSSDDKITLGNAALVKPMNAMETTTLTTTNSDGNGNAFYKEQIDMLTAITREQQQKLDYLMNKDTSIDVDNNNNNNAPGSGKKRSRDEVNNSNHSLLPSLSSTTTTDCSESTAATSSEDANEATLLDIDGDDDVVGIDGEPSTTAHDDIDVNENNNECDVMLNMENLFEEDSKNSNININDDNKQNNNNSRKENRSYHKRRRGSFIPKPKSTATSTNKNIDSDNISVSGINMNNMNNVNNNEGRVPTPPAGSVPARRSARLSLATTITDDSTTNLINDENKNLYEGKNNNHVVNKKNSNDINKSGNDAKNNNISKLQAAPLSRLNAKLGELNKRRQAALANGNGNDEENVSLEPVWKAL